MFRLKIAKKNTPEDQQTGPEHAPTTVRLRRIRQTTTAGLLPSSSRRPSDAGSKPLSL